MDANEIHTFIKSNMNFIEKNKLSNKSRFFLNQLVHICKTVHKMHPTPQITIMPSDHTMDMELVPNEIREYIVKVPFKQVYSCVFQIGQRQINLHVMVFKRTRKTAFTNMLEKVYLWLSIAFQYAMDECAPALTIQFFMTPLKKQMPIVPGTQIDIVHANTAFTYACMTNQPGTISIFRIEEWFKVFIHETFHCLGLDFSRHRQEEINSIKLLLTQFQVKSPLCISETYTEIWANIMNIIVFYTLQQMQLVKIVEHLIYELNVERKFAIFQAGKLLHHYGGKYENCLVNSNKKIEYNETNTNSFCYYVVRALLMYDLNGFLEWCVKHNNGTFAFTNPKINVNKFVQELIVNKCRNTQFAEMVNRSQEILETNSEMDVKKTLRMTVFG